MLEPNAIVIYVDNLDLSTRFYQALLGTKPETPSTTFSMFHLSNGMMIGLKDKQSIEPKVEGQGRNELAFSVENDKQLDVLVTEWQQKGITIVQHPTHMPFGYTFLALDPDGNGLRVLSAIAAN
jgi:predicted enzyme related to lactoylglutathione lyase